MKREAGGPCLSAVFVDYDNIYLSLKRKSEEAAKRFAKDASGWLRGIETGRLITATNAPFGDNRRRIVMNRCYGNPVPRRNAHDNSTDMNSFPFVRHHFLRAGFEVIDCPPLTAQLKNSSDIRMVMDIRDYLTHDTYFDEFIILSGDADFTPGPAPPARACPAHGDLRQRLHGRALHRDQRRRGAGVRPDCAHPERRDAEGGGRREIGRHAFGQEPTRPGAISWPRWWRPCAPRARRCRSRRWPNGPCARSATRRPSAPAGPARAVSVSCCASICRARSN